MSRKNRAKNICFCRVKFKSLGFTHKNWSIETIHGLNSQIGITLPFNITGINLY